MDRQEPVQVSFQLPQGALEGFSRLVEQLRLLAAQLGSGTAPAAPAVREGMENPAFDWQRFYELGQGAPPPESARIPDREEIPTPPAPAEDVRESGDETGRAPSAGGEKDRQLEARAVRENADTPLPEALQARAVPEKSVPEAPQALPLPETPLADAPSARLEPESRIPEAEAAWASAEPQVPAPSPVRTAEPAALEMPEGAGFSLGTGPEGIQSRWTGIAEELTVDGPAPLTAEAVSQAFQRDGRRYDNGFPLY